MKIGWIYSGFKLEKVKRGQRKSIMKKAKMMIEKGNGNRKESSVSILFVPTYGHQREK